MFEINCPSCGTPIRFRRESSLYATCESCRSVLLRQDVNVKMLGKAADLQPDNTPLQVGTRGRYQTQSFEILGRIQVHQEDGYWNEWYLNFDDGSDGWLGEALGEYFLNRVYQPKRNEQLPEFKQLHIGKCITIGNQRFYVTNLAKSVVSSYEGELPFMMSGAYAVPNADLRSFGNKACTLDYSDAEPTCYVGVYVEFNELNFTNLRDPEDHIQKRSIANTTQIKCPCCGGPHELSSAAAVTQTLVCEYCGAGLDISKNDKYSVLWESQKDFNKFKSLLRIPLGTVGEIDGIKWEVIGFQAKYSRYDGAKFYWYEYLCYNQYHGYRYLVESDAHWSWCQTLHQLPSNSGRSNRPTSYEKHFVDGRCFKHFSSYRAFVALVVGEFPYKVDLTSSNDIADYICPPFGLSREAGEQGNNSEEYWSLARYMEASEVRQAFNITSKLPTASAIGSFQINPHKEKSYKNCTVGCLTILLSFFAFMAFISREHIVFTHTYGINVGTEPSVLSEPFQLEGEGKRAVQIDIDTQMNNRWLYADLALVNTDTNEAYLASKQVSYYSGHDSDGDWSEGSRSGDLIIPRVDPGNYILRVDPQTGTGDSPQQIYPAPKDAQTKDKKVLDYKITVTDKPAMAGMWLFLLVLIAPLPLWNLYRWYSTEVERWEDSDHPWRSDDDDDDD